MSSLKFFLEFYLVDNSFCLKRLRSKLQKLLIAISEQFRLNLVAFSDLIHLKNCFPAKFSFKNSPEYPDATDTVESTANLK